MSTDVSDQAFKSMDEQSQPPDALNTEKSEESETNSDDFVDVQEIEEIFEKNLELAMKHKSEGNNFYKLKQYEQALDAYSLAIRHCPNPIVQQQDEKDEETKTEPANDEFSEHL